MVYGVRLSIMEQITRLQLGVDSCVQKNVKSVFEKYKMAMCKSSRAISQLQDHF